jgi:ATP-dependent Lon protease
VVRKDLVRQFRGAGNSRCRHTWSSFMLGRYCATTDEQEIAEGLDIVRTQLSSRTVRADEDELVKSNARKSGAVRVIDIITARLEARSDSYLASLPSLRLSDVRIADELVHENDRMLQAGPMPRSGPARNRARCGARSPQHGAILPMGRTA